MLLIFNCYISIDIFSMTSLCIHKHISGMLICSLSIKLYFSTVVLFHQSLKKYFLIFLSDDGNITKKSFIQPEEMVKDVLGTKALFENFASYMLAPCLCLFIADISEVSRKRIQKEARDYRSWVQHRILYLCTKSLEAMLNLLSKW